jgi:hypothetical protein
MTLSSPKLVPGKRSDAICYSQIDICASELRLGAYNVGGAGSAVLAVRGSAESTSGSFRIRVSSAS